MSVTEPGKSEFHAKLVIANQRAATERVKKMTRTFEAKPAVREHVPLLVVLIGPSVSGKTYSALRLATGIQRVTGGDVYGIDTEARRMLHYSDGFKFKHIDFAAPFGSHDYLASLQYAVALGAKVVIVDSFSHEHDGPGGMLDYYDAELERLAGNDYAKRERVKMLAWQRPKAARRRLISGLLQLNANFIFCFRAKETVKPIKGQIVQMGFMPIAGEEFLFEQTVNCLLLPKSGGVPAWDSENVGEKLMMKLPKQFERLFSESKPLDETTGEALARWAAGSNPPSKPCLPAPETVDTTPSSPINPAPTGLADEGVTGTDEFKQIDYIAGEAAKRGTEVLKIFWAGLTPDHKRVMKEAFERRHKITAAEADKALSEAES